MRTQVTNTIRACFAALHQIRSVRWSPPQHALLTLIRTLVITKLDQCTSVLVGISVYLQDRLQSVLNAAARLVYILAPDVRTHNSITMGVSLVAHPGVNPVPVVCSDVPLCAWHSTGIPVWQPAADIRDSRSSMSPLCWHHDTTSAVDSSGYPRRPRLSGGCSAGMEQSATRDLDLLLTFDIPEGDFFVSHTADLALSTLTVSRRLRELCNSFRRRFCPAAVWWQHYDPITCSSSRLVVLINCIVGFQVPYWPVSVLKMLKLADWCLSDVRAVFVDLGSGGSCHWCGKKADRGCLETVRLFSFYYNVLHSTCLVCGVILLTLCLMDIHSVSRQCCAMLIRTQTEAVRAWCFEMLLLQFWLHWQMFHAQHMLDLVSQSVSNVSKDIFRQLLE